jgi:CHAT domain-containing protein
VLSACQSGLGKHFEMGTASVARAFHHDGASAVVMSLWNVDDEATRRLMVAFTKNAFKKGNPAPPDRALREAMRELRKTEPDPLYWAGFNVFGLPALDK